MIAVRSAFGSVGVAERHGFGPSALRIRVTCGIGGARDAAAPMTARGTREASHALARVRAIQSGRDPTFGLAGFTRLPPLFRGHGVRTKGGVWKGGVWGFNPLFRGHGVRTRPNVLTVELDLEFQSAVSRSWRPDRSNVLTVELDLEFQSAVSRSWRPDRSN